MSIRDKKKMCVLTTKLSREKVWSVKYIYQYAHAHTHTRTSPCFVMQCLISFVIEPCYVVSNNVVFCQVKTQTSLLLCLKTSNANRSVAY